MDSNEIMRQVMARLDFGRAFYARTIAKDTGLSLDEVEGALSRLCAQGLVDAHNEAEDPVYFAAGRTVVVNNASATSATDHSDARPQSATAPAPDQAECLQQPQSAALVISGRLTSVGETFATILTGTRTLADQLAGVSSQQVTLGINTEQARWLGKYVGGEVKLTVEVTP